MVQRCKETGGVFINGELVAKVQCGCGEGHSIAGHYGALVVVIDGQENNLSVMWGGASMDAICPPGPLTQPFPRKRP